jgi:hypothetical protein
MIAFGLIFFPSGTEFLVFIMIISFFVVGIVTSMYILLLLEKFLYPDHEDLENDPTNQQSPSATNAQQNNPDPVESDPVESDPSGMGDTVPPENNETTNLADSYCLDQPQEVELAHMKSAEIQLVSSEIASTNL